MTREQQEGTAGVRTPDQQLRLFVRSTLAMRDEIPAAASSSSSSSSSWEPNCIVALESALDAVLAAGITPTLR